MQAKEFISDIFPAININDNGEKALVRMDFFKISHIPLTDTKGNYYGLISENEIYDFNLLQKPFETYKNILIRPFVYEDQHIYDIIALFSNLKISVVPILTRKNKYKGAVCLQELMKYFSNIFETSNNGTIFILEMSIHDYSLTQISRIIEENGAKILNLHSSIKKTSSKIELTIKINTTDFSAIRQSLERHNYYIKSSYSKDDKINELIDERYEEFMNYLNI